MKRVDSKSVKLPPGTSFPGEARIPLNNSPLDGTQERNNLRWLGINHILCFEADVMHECTGTQTLSSDSQSLDLSIISSSADLGWQGIRVERAVAYDLAMDKQAFPLHTFSLVTGPAYEWESLENGRFQKMRSCPGDVSVYPADRAVSQRFEGYKEFVCLTVEPAALVNMASDPTLELRTGFHNRHNVNDPQLKALLTAFLAEAEAGGPNGRMFVDALMTAFSVHYLTHYAETRLSPEPGPGLEQRQIGRAKEFIAAHLAENISLDQVAKAAGMSKFHFSRRFKDKIGITPHQYLLKSRTQKAKELLKKGRSIAGVAYELGFNDQSHFGRIFLKNEGVSPGAFARSFQR
ncbi:MAG: helix-turn-helix transcriptional regulator [Desulfobacteraceae bacterium]|nr:helix-turn-helix transcriptional regulator [Desulfobacteraceae bacterium]